VAALSPWVKPKKTRTSAGLSAVATIVLTTVSARQIVRTRRASRTNSDLLSVAAWAAMAGRKLG